MAWGCLPFSSIGTLLVLCSTKRLHITVVLYTDWELFKAGYITEPGLEISAAKTQLRTPCSFSLKFFSFIYLWEALSTPVYEMMNTVLLENNKSVEYWCNHGCDGNLNLDKAGKRFRGRSPNLDELKSQIARSH